MCFYEIKCFSAEGLSQVRVPSWLPLLSVSSCLFQRLVTGAIFTDLAVELLLLYLSLITLSFIFLLLIVLVISRLSLCSVIMLCSGVTHIYFVCTPWRVERRTAALCLAPLLGGYSCASAGSWSVISLLGRHLAADRSWITPENCSLFSSQFIFVVCTIGE